MYLTACAKFYTTPPPVREMSLNPPKRVKIDDYERKMYCSVISSSLINSSSITWYESRWIIWICHINLTSWISELLRSQFSRFSVFCRKHPPILPKTPTHFAEIGFKNGLLPDNIRLLGPEKWSVWIKTYNWKQFVFIDLLMQYKISKIVSEKYYRKKSFHRQDLTNFWKKSTLSDDSQSIFGLVYPFSSSHLQLGTCP